MTKCEDCNRIEVCTTCGEKICKIHHSKIEFCKTVGYFEENGELICEKCHKK